MTAPPAVAQDPVIAAAGDIACDPDDPDFNGGAGVDGHCRQRATSDLLVSARSRGRAAARRHPVRQLVAVQHQCRLQPDLGAGQVDQPSDPRQPRGQRDRLLRLLQRRRASQDGPAGPRGKGYYSFDLGSWHLVALNSNCARVSCSAGSEQEQWLRADLAAHPSACTLAYWHHPRYSSGHEENNTFMQPLWEALDDSQAELVLSGHSHDYERFAPQDRNGNLDPANGIRQFVVGTGGAFFTGGLGSLMPNSEVAQNDTFGVLFLTLHPTSYDWPFVPEAGKTFTDSGSTACHGPGRAPPPPPPPPPDRDAAGHLEGDGLAEAFHVAPRAAGLSRASRSPLSASAPP